MAGKKKSIIISFIEVIVLAVFIKPMFSLGLLTGISYLLAFAGAVYSRIVFRKRKIAAYLIAGTFLTWIAGMIMIRIWDCFDNENWVTFAVMTAICMMVWLKGHRMRTGKR